MGINEVPVFDILSEGLKIVGSGNAEIGLPLAKLRAAIKRLTVYAQNCKCAYAKW